MTAVWHCFSCISSSEAASASFLQGFSGNTDLSSLGPLSEDSVALIKAGVPRLAQAGAKLNELAKQLPETLANIDPNTAGDIAKVNGIVGDICDKAMAKIKPTAYTKNYTPQGLKTCQSCRQSFQVNSFWRTVVSFI